MDTILLSLSKSQAFLHLPYSCFKCRHGGRSLKLGAISSSVRDRMNHVSKKIHTAALPCAYDKYHDTGDVVCLLRNSVEQYDGRSLMVSRT